MPTRLEGRHEQQRDPGHPGPGQLRPVHGGQRGQQPRARPRARRRRAAHGRSTAGHCPAATCAGTTLTSRCSSSVRHRPPGHGEHVVTGASARRSPAQRPHAFTSPCASPPSARYTSSRLGRGQGEVVQRGEGGPAGDGGDRRAGLARARAAASSGGPDCDGPVAQRGDLGHVAAAPRSRHTRSTRTSPATSSLSPAGVSQAMTRPSVEHRDPVEHGLRLDDVVGDQQDGRARARPAAGPRRPRRRAGPPGPCRWSARPGPAAAAPPPARRRSRRAGAGRRTASSAGRPAIAVEPQLVEHRVPLGPRRAHVEPAQPCRWSRRRAPRSARRGRWTPGRGRRAAGRPARGGGRGRGRGSRRCPRSGRSSPVSWRTRVDLPAPLGPSSPKISPRRTSRPMPSVARTSGVRGRAAAAAHRGIGLDQAAHGDTPTSLLWRAGAACAVPVLTRDETTRGPDAGQAPGAVSGPPARRSCRARSADGRGHSPAPAACSAARADVDLAPEPGPDRVAVVLVDLVVLVGEQTEAGGVAQQLAVDAVRDPRVHRGQLLQVAGVGEPLHPAAGEDLADLEGVAADGGDVLLAVGPALLGAGELGEGGQRGGLGGLARRRRAASTQPLSEDQRRVAAGGGLLGGGWAAGRRAAAPARSLGVGTPLAPAAGARPGAPFCRRPAARPAVLRGCRRRPALARGRGERPDSGSGAERIAAISGRGAGGGAQIPPRSLARTALVIHARSSTRRSSASATRSSDWL